MSNKTVWKFTLNYEKGPQNIMIPKGAVFLSGQIQYSSGHLQYGVPTMWFEVDTAQEREERCFRLIDTGDPLPPSCKIFRATLQLQYGQRVLHIYEEDMAEMVMSTGIQYQNITQFPLMPTGTA